MIRVILPAPLRSLAQTSSELGFDLAPPHTQRSLLDALEARHPALCGTVRDPATGQRRPFIRFFACQQDLSLEPPDAPLPVPVSNGSEPFLIIAAVAGG